MANRIPTTTSALLPKGSRTRNRLPCWRNKFGTTSTGSGGPRTQYRVCAFTLIEVLLAVVLLLLLLGAAVFSFSSLRQGAELDEGVDQFETLLRYARAHAAYTGCKVKLLVGTAVDENAAGPGMQVRWEPDPLQHPGTWENLSGSAWNLEGIGGLVQVKEIRGLTAESAVTAAAAEFRGENSPTLATVIFQPDGTSDSVEVVLASRAPDDLRQIAVQLVGITGSIRHHLSRNEDGTEAPTMPTRADSAPAPARP